MLKCGVCMGHHITQLCPQITNQNIQYTPEDNVNHPSHYNQIPGIECQQVTKHFNFNKGNALKYIWRAGYKDKGIEDLRKAMWYLEDEIKRIENE
jgi:uncharacterized protein DUF3310